MRPDPIAAAKTALRKQMQARRADVCTACQIQCTDYLAADLALDSFRAADSVLGYMSIGSEFDTRTLLEHALAQGKSLLLPRVVRGSPALALHVVRDLARDLQPGVWGILELRSECP
jgi:5-formyltetrahydrofolate cyclo-ligase